MGAIRQSETCLPSFKMRRNKILAPLGAGGMGEVYKAIGATMEKFTGGRFGAERP
jgi:hypothetical protein